MTSTPLVHSLSQATCMAASCLAASNYGEAACLLHKTLKTLKIRSRMQQNIPLPVVPISYRAGSVTVSNDQCHRSANDSTFALSDRFFLIPLECDERRPVDLFFMSFMTLYNLAMVHHQVALRTGQSSEFAKAIEVYSFALSVLQRFPQDNTASVRVLCSLYNNLGHAYEQLGAFQNSQSCLGQMLQVLEAVQTGFNPGQLLAEDDFDFYYQYCGMEPGRSFCTATMA